MNQSHNCFTHIYTFNSVRYFILLHFSDSPSLLNLNVFCLVFVVHLKPVSYTLCGSTQSLRLFSKRVLGVLIYKLSSILVFIFLSLTMMLIKTVSFRSIIKIDKYIPAMMSCTSFSCMSSQR